ncbi:DNA-formamidopyrimidine glycosylase family protein [Gordonia sp. ABSL1-1]|uniref:DNA-formamidopyrimidine glycosylase family protein n=1 Tax=Gordonia sp. ABSL1-1 TaxID=3053923 RepID=UPI00257244FC|nr:DNA-formamidopyrimidine glycosylase family protein [Gordonia sp. ABSL1-1]MDL9937139.1 DNA-formamidopyrimidine glycosylase family protein [Gordonia sp. ABSL1-1]
MPEGDTVYQAASRLRRALAGATLDHCDFRVPKLATIDLTGRRVGAVRSVGKHLFIDIDAADDGAPPSSIHSHLKMEGTWDVHRLGQRWRRPTFQARIILRANGYEAVGANLGILELTTDPDHCVAHLGPDLLADDWDRAEALHRLAADPDRPVGLALLDQRVMAGVGNVYRSEICFLARTPPTRPVEQTNTEQIVDLARRLLWDNRNRPARSTTGQAAPHARTWVYGRAGRLCRRCATVIEQGRLSDTATDADRVVYYCPRCQR